MMGKAAAVEQRKSGVETEVLNTTIRADTKRILRAIAEDRRMPMGGVIDLLVQLAERRRAEKSGS